ncbi:MAG: efflux RND transporter periplasmic adaptor subunit [Pseudomonadota bacterium]
MHEPVGLKVRPSASVMETRSAGGLGARAKVALAIVAIILIGLAAWYFMRDAGAAAPADQEAAAAGPVVSVFVPGAQPVTARVRVAGSVAARRDLPVGVQGQGGMVTAVLVDEGDYVRKGQILARIDKALQAQQLAQLRAAVAQREADAALAQAELDRAAALIERRFISGADVDRRTATRDGALAQVDVAKAQLRAAEEQMAQLDVRAPEAGLILRRTVEPGQVVGPQSGALFRIAQDGDMELRAEVAERDLVGLKPGQAATIELAGKPAGYRGEVSMVEPLIDPVSRQGTARVRIAGDRDVRPGAFATGTIETATVERPLLPESAVLGGGDDSYVYVVGDDNVARRQKVIVGLVTAEGVVIDDGLEGTERVVISAGAFLNDGETVQPRLVEGEERG